MFADPALLLITIVVLLFSLSVHESAHAWTADLLGDPTSRYLGRVTLNPLKHIDPIGTILFPVLGLLSGGFIFGWAKPVSVNTRNLKNPKKDHLLIAAAGPLSNVMLAVFFLMGLKMISFLGLSFVRQEHAIVLPLFEMCRVGLFLNVILAVFNLIPIPPLDGSWILSGFLPDNLSIFIDRIRPYSFVLLILLLMSGVFSRILNPILRLVDSLAF